MTLASKSCEIQSRAEGHMTRRALMALAPAAGFSALAGGAVAAGELPSLPELIQFHRDELVRLLEESAPAGVGVLNVQLSQSEYREPIFAAGFLKGSSRLFQFRPAYHQGWREVTPYIDRGAA